MQLNVVLYFYHLNYLIVLFETITNTFILTLSENHQILLHTTLSELQQF